VAKSLRVILVKIPPNITTDTLLAKIPTPSGIITHMHFETPPGVQYLAGIRMANNGNQILPILEYGDEDQSLAWADRYLTGDGTKVDSDVEILVEEGELEIYGINYNDIEARFIIIISFEPVWG